MILVGGVGVQILRFRSAEHRAHNLLKPSIGRLDQGEGYTSYVGGFTSIGMRLYFL